jgi:hypothetical protein
VEDRATTARPGLDGALARARAYLETHGDRLDLARLAGAGPAEPPEPQNPDGGWPGRGSAGASTVLGTCRTLDLLAGLDLVGADRTAAAGFLVAAQAADGTWAEDSGEPGWSDGAPTEWLRPGSPPAGTHLTAYCARVLLVCAPEQPELPDVLEHAAQALEWALDPHGRLPAALPAHWFAARVFRATGRQLQARRLLDVVGRLFEQLEVADLVSFGADAEPGDRWSRRIAARLLTLQQPDGSWTAEGVLTPVLTVDAIRALQHVPADEV